MKKMLKTVLTLMIAVPIAMSASSAFAFTAANTTITNTATLTYNGGSKTATALVTVSLVPSTPNILLNGNSAGYLGPNSPVLPDSLLITSTANGPATYHVTAVIGSGANVSVNTTGATVADGGGFDILALGASVTTATATNQSTTTTLVIPAPDATHITGAPGSWVVNGLGIGTTVTFSTFTRSISAITQNADFTFTLTLDAAAGAVPAGTPVYEQRTVSGITALPGTVTTLGTDIHVYAQATVSTAGAGNAVSNWADNKWTSSLATVELNKFTRNLTAAGNPTSGSCFTGKTNFTVNTVPSDFFSCGVTGKTGDVLEYVVLAKNTSLTTDLTGSLISDQIPTAYVTFFFGGYGGGNDVFYSSDGSGSGTTTFTAAGVNANQASFSPWPFPAPVPASVTLSVNVGAGASNSTPGTIAKEAVAGTPTALFIAYKVTIK